NGVVHVIDAVLVPTTIISVDENYNNAFGIYPNPTNRGMVTLEGITLDNEIIQIFSMDGKLVRENRVSGNVIDLSDLERGCYLVTVLKINTHLTTRLVVE
ncbi:MAG: T9SS type A sorting domain-containing protein, partial [Saprospiraceae bacterium]